MRHIVPHSSRTAALLVLLLCAALLTACSTAGAASFCAAADGGQRAPAAASGRSGAADASAFGGSGASEPPLCGLPRAEDTPASEAPALSLTLGQTVFPLSGGEDAPQIPYTVHNSTGETLGFLSVPLLERETDGGWETVACDAAFCGTPDPLEEAREGVLPLSLYPALVPGTYRLSYRIVPWEGDAPEQETVVRATFVLA